MNPWEQLVVFSLDAQRYALQLSVVQRIVCAVDVTPLPSAPAIVLGVINIEGRIVPVINVRKRFWLPDKQIGLNDHLIIATTAKRPVALLADSVSGVVEVSRNAVVDSSSVLPRSTMWKALQNFRTEWSSFMTSTHFSPWMKTGRSTRQYRKTNFKSLPRNQKTG